MEISQRTDMEISQRTDMEMQNGECAAGNEKKASKAQYCSQKCYSIIFKICILVSNRHDFEFQLFPHKLCDLEKVTSMLLNLSLTIIKWSNIHITG